MNRLAGKALGDFFRTGMGMLSSAAEQGTLGYLQNAAKLLMPLEWLAVLRNLRLG
jgi:hypothetical protein